MNRINQHHLIMAITMIFLATGCGKDPIPGMAELEQLCLKDAGAIINGIEKVNGYYDSYTKEYGGFDEIVYGQYDFIEYEHVENKPGTPVYNMPVGFYRDYKAAKGDQLCNPFYTRKIQEYNVEPYVSFARNHCVATKKINIFKSKYQYSAKDRRWDNKEEGYKIFRSEEIIKNLETKEILGQEVGYLLIPYGLFKTPESYMTYECSQINKFKYQSTKNKNVLDWVFGR